MVKKIIILIVTLMLSSCGCNYHLKKVEKKCGYSTSTEVVTFHDTIYTERIVKDTIFSFTNSSDTIILKQDNLQIKYFYNTHDSTVYIKGECKTDTIYKDRVVTINNKTYEWSLKEAIKSNLLWIGLILFIVLILLMASKFILK
jgi:hypothetical protein